MQRLLIRILTALCLASTLGACALLTGTRQRAEHPLRDAAKLVDPRSGQEVIFVWMQHLSTDAGYAEIRNYLDKLKSKGYVTFCEGVVPIPRHIDTIGGRTMRQIGELDRTLSAHDSLRLDTMMRKSRCLLGFMLGEGGYADPENKSLPGRSKHKGYISQTNEILGVTTDRDIWADYSMGDMVGIYERRYGEIPLTEYDFRTGFLEKYTSPVRISQWQRSWFVLFMRNDYLVRRIAESPHPKIVVVYGAAHSYGVLWQLKKHHGYKPDRKFKAE